MPQQNLLPSFEGKKTDWPGREIIFRLGWMPQSTLNLCAPGAYHCELSIFGFVDVWLLPGGENHGSFFPGTDLELEAIIKQVKTRGILPGLQSLLALAASAQGQAQQQSPGCRGRGGGSSAASGRRPKALPPTPPEPYEILVEKTSILEHLRS